VPQLTTLPRTLYILVQYVQHTNLNTTP
jgi:hypothetical protein